MLLLARFTSIFVNFVVFTSLVKYNVNVKSKKSKCNC